MIHSPKPCWANGAMPMKWFIMARVNSHGMTIKMAFVKFEFVLKDTLHYR